MKMMSRIFPAIALAVSVAQAGTAQGAEFYIGEPVVKNGMQIVPAHLPGIEMEGEHAHGDGIVHIEVDVHAAKDEAHGFAEDAWIPNLTIGYTLEKVGSRFKVSGKLLPMIAKDGPHYATNVKFDGAGEYKLTYRFEPPSSTGFLRHVDKATGVPAWWQPFAETWTFTFPSKEKG
jgi:periplasmic iron binding protein